MTQANIDHYNTAIDALQTGKFDEAIQAIENALMEDPADTDAWQVYILALQATGRNEDARKATEKLKSLGISEAREHLLAAADATAAGNHAAAVEACRNAIASDPEHPEAHSTMALALFEAGDRVAAIEAARKAVELSPDEARSHYILGRLLRLSGESDAAMDALAAATELDDTLAMAFYEHGMLLVDADRLEEALANFEFFLQNHPGDPGATQAVNAIRARMSRTL